MPKFRSRLRLTYSFSSLADRSYFPPVHQKKSSFPSCFTFALLISLGRKESLFVYSSIWIVSLWKVGKKKNQGEKHIMSHIVGRRAWDKTEKCGGGGQTGSTWFEASASTRVIRLFLCGSGIVSHVVPSFVMGAANEMVNWGGGEYLIVFVLKCFLISAGEHTRLVDVYWGIWFLQAFIWQNFHSIWVAPPPLLFFGTPHYVLQYF